MSNERIYTTEDVKRKFVALGMALSARLTEYAGRVKEGWRQRVRRRRGWLGEAIDVREGLAKSDFRRQLIVDTKKDPRVTYGDVYERGRKPPVNYAGNFPLGLALEAEHDRIDRDIEATCDAHLR